MSALKTITFYAMMAAFIAAVCWLSDSARETESPFNTAKVVWDPLWTTDLAKSAHELRGTDRARGILPHHDSTVAIGPFPPAASPSTLAGGFVSAP